MRPAGIPHLLESLLMRSWENWQKPEKGEISYQSQFWTATYGAVLQNSFHSRFRMAGEKKIRSLEWWLVNFHLHPHWWVILPLPSVRNTLNSPNSKEWTWIQKVSGKQSFNDGLARLGVWWVGTARVVTMSNLSLPHKSLPQFLINWGVNEEFLIYYGVISLPGHHLALSPSTLWTGPSLTSCFLLSWAPIPSHMYGCESWTIRKAEHQRIDTFELWCWRRLLRVPWTARRTNQSILKEISPEYLLEGPTLKLELQ